ncbi:MAG TPA: SPOR domain-containing protein [Dongiaceae bacterium]|nr:SPOR domain-containing protein [Dongiaceae bacterium]
MKRILLVTTLLAGLSTPVYAGVNEGVAAATAGDYARAFAEFEPVANAGDPVAQYYLAKLYLEGRGPADGVARGVDMMTKAANGGYPEAQAQLGLMYAMGMGVPADNVKAHDLLTKALAALPDGVRRTVAEANRDTVLQRMTPAQRNALASRTLSTESAPAVAATPEAAAPAPKPAATEVKKPETAQIAAADPAPAAPLKPAAKPEAKPEIPAAKVEPADKPATSQTAAATTKPTDAKPADKPATVPVAAASKPAEATPAAPKPTTTQIAAADQKPAETKPADSKPADTKPTTTQIASAEPAKPATPATEAEVKAGARIQIASLPTEDGAWAGWKEISAKYKDQLTGLTPVVESADLGTKGTFYRVRVGPFETMAAATERCTAMKQAGLDCLVVK